MFENDFIGLLPEIFLVNATIILLIYGALFSTSNLVKRVAPLVRNVAWLGLLSILITIVLIATQPLGGSPVANLCYNTLVIDNFTYFCKIILLCSTASTILMSFQYFQQETVNTFESIILMLLSTCSMLFMISAYDLIAIYLAIELQSLCFYVIAASKRTSEFSTEAGLKYFILGAFSSGILLFGCSLIYGFTGVTNLEELAKIFTLGAQVESFVSGNEQFSYFQNSGMSFGIFIGILFLAVGFLFKITAVPFHMWAPDVYEGAPTFVTAFFMIAPKIAILANMLRVFIFSVYDPTWQQLFFFCSIASMILGSVAGLAQNKVKRLLAYSSIAHVGYLLVGFSCGTIQGVQSLLIGIFIYVLMTVNAFAIILALRPFALVKTASQIVKTKRNKFALKMSSAVVKYISDLSALAKTNPILAITLSITMFSYAGIPPLAGFCSKFYLFFAALSCGAYLLALVGIITSVISCFYYIRFVKVMYFDTPLRGLGLFRPMDREKSLLLGITLFGITFFCVYPAPFFVITHQMALSLCF